jgi:hypothetical protein
MHYPSKGPVKKGFWLNIFLGILDKTRAQNFTFTTSID